MSNSKDYDHISKIIDDHRILVSNQRSLINIKKENTFTTELLNTLFNKYSDIGTVLPLTELWTNVSNSRSLCIPRPQNSFILYRRDISKGLIKANQTMNVRNSSKFASYIWKSLSEHEKGFWSQLFKIARAKHNTNYPNYKFNPIRRNKNSDKKKRKRTKPIESSDPQLDSNDKVSNDKDSNDINKMDLNDKNSNIVNDIDLNMEIDANILESSDMDIDLPDSFTENQFISSISDQNFDISVDNQMFLTTLQDEMAFMNEYEFFSRDNFYSFSLNNNNNR